MEQTSRSMQRLARRCAVRGGDGGWHIRIRRLSRGRRTSRTARRRSKSASSTCSISTRSSRSSWRWPRRFPPRSTRGVRRLACGPSARCSCMSRASTTCTRRCHSAQSGRRSSPRGSPPWTAFEKMSTKDDVLKHLKEGFAYAQSAVNGVDPAALAGSQETVRRELYDHRDVARHGGRHARAPGAADRLARGERHQAALVQVTSSGPGPSGRRRGIAGGLLAQ